MTKGVAKGVSEYTGKEECARPPFDQSIRVVYSSSLFEQQTDRTFPLWTARAPMIAADKFGDISRAAMAKLAGKFSKERRDSEHAVDQLAARTDSMRAETDGRSGTASASSWVGDHGVELVCRHRAVDGAAGSASTASPLSE
jgi:hypothetical protein